MTHRPHIITVTYLLENNKKHKIAKTLYLTYRQRFLKYYTGARTIKHNNRLFICTSKHMYKNEKIVPTPNEINCLDTYIW